MFVELVKFSADPFIAIRAFQTRASSVLGPSSHVSRIGCGDEKDGLIEIPSAQNVMYDPELVDRDLREGRCLQLAVGMVRRDDQRDDVVHCDIESRESVHDFPDSEHWCPVTLHECVKLEMVSPI
jgi:hypothetical protein